MQSNNFFAPRSREVQCGMLAWQKKITRFPNSLPFEVLWKKSHQSSTQEKQRVQGKQIICKGVQFNSSSDHLYTI